MCENITCKLEDCVVEYGYCHCGCGGKTSISKRNRTNPCRIKGVPCLNILHHGRKGKFKLQYVVDEETKCWEWQGCKNTYGYGEKNVAGKCTPAHRHYYELHKGPIPEGLQIDHLCRNPGCVNPEHLEAVTQAENIRRGNATKLNWEKVYEIRLLYNQNNAVSQANLAKKYFVDYCTINNIINNKTWVIEPMSFVESS